MGTSCVLVSLSLEVVIHFLKKNPDYMNYWIFYLSKILALRYKRSKKIFLFLLKNFCTIYFGHNSFPFPNSSQILSQALYQPNFMLVWAKKLLPSGTLWEIADFPSRCQLQIVSYKGMRKLCPLTLLTAAALSSLWKSLGVCITPVVSGGHCFPGVTNHLWLLPFFSLFLL